MAITIPANTILNTGSASPALSFDLAAPSGAGDDDLDVIFAVIRAGVTAQTRSISDGLGSYGSPVLAGFADADGNNRCSLDVWAKAGETSPAQATVSLSGAATQVGLLVRLRVSGVDLSDPIAAVSGSLAEGTAAPSDNATFTALGITTPVDNCLAVPVIGWGTGYLGGSAGARFTASGWTSGPLNDRTASAASQVSAALFTKVITTAGSTGDCVFDPADSVQADARNWIAGIVAFRPVAGGPPPVIRRSRVIGPF